MITSRTGEKHRQRALEIGVQRYLGKPYQEPELMRNVFELLAEQMAEWGSPAVSPSRRVVLLARPGPACERLAEAAREAGAEIALVADPTDTEPEAVRAAQPEALLVALEPAVETAIERFQDIYTDPDVIVLFEEADLIVERQGWDAARWLRHMATSYAHARRRAARRCRTRAARTRGRGRTPDAVPAPGMEGDIGGFTDEAASVVADVPSDAMLDQNAPRPALESVPAASSRRCAIRCVPSSTPSTCAPRAWSWKNIPRKEAVVSRGTIVLLAGLGGPDAVRPVPRRASGRFRADRVRPPATRRRPPRQAVAADAARHDLAAAAGRGRPRPGTRARTWSRATSAWSPAAMARASPRARMPSQLTPGDNAIVALSGTDPTLVEAIMAQSWAGALVLAQLPSGCYEPTAVQALIARGIASDTPPHLASQLAKRWPARTGSEP